MKKLFVIFFFLVFIFLLPYSVISESLNDLEKGDVIARTIKKWGFEIREIHTAIYLGVRDDCEDDPTNEYLHNVAEMLCTGPTDETTLADFKKHNYVGAKSVSLSASKRNEVVLKAKEEWLQNLPYIQPDPMYAALENLQFVDVNGDNRITLGIEWLEIKGIRSDAWLELVFVSVGVQIHPSVNIMKEPVKFAELWWEYKPQHQFSYLNYPSGIGPSFFLKDIDGNVIPEGSTIKDSSFFIHATDGPVGSGLMLLEIWDGNPNIPNENTVLVKQIKKRQEIEYIYKPSEIGNLSESDKIYIRIYDQAGNYTTQNFIISDLEPPTSEHIKTEAEKAGIHKIKFKVNDKFPLVDMAEKKRGLSDLTNLSKFGVYYYDLDGNRKTILGLKFLLNDPETQLPYKAVYTIQTADHSTGYSECPLLESGYKELYVYATDLAGNMTPTHPDYGASSRSGLYDAARSLMDYCIGYIYTERYPDEDDCFEDPPDDIDVYNNVYYEDSTGKIVTTSDGLDTFSGSDSTVSEESSMFSYDYYNPTYEGYLKDHEAGVFLAGTYPAMDVMTTNLLNPTQLVHSKLWNPEEFLKKHKMVLLPSGSLIGRGEDSDLAQKFHNYVNAGGILFVFSQKRGSDFKVLPGSPDGFGYVEDQNCFRDSAYVDTWHPMLASITRNPATAHFDGFFTEYPSNATVLLRRKANGQPCLLIYPYGDGHVILSSLYTDYAYGVEMASFSEIKLVRDIIAWSNSSWV